MLEADGILRTWALTELPRDWANLAPFVSDTLGSAMAVGITNTVDADQLADHRVAYLDFEGPLSGGRGAVRRLDAGSFTTIHETPTTWQLTLDGGMLRGDIKLERSAAAQLWRLTFRPVGSCDE